MHGQNLAGPSSPSSPSRPGYGYVKLQPDVLHMDVDDGLLDVDVYPLQPGPGWYWRPRLVKIVVPTIATFALVTAWGAPRRAFLQSHLGRGVVEKATTRWKLERDAQCGLIEENQEYVGVADLRHSEQSSAFSCCAECRAHEQCDAWSWGIHYDGANSTCSLKKLQPKQVPTKVARPGAVSGMPYRANLLGSLFCFALMLPNSYEVDLLSMQYTERASLFACDEYAVYSNISTSVAEGVRTSVVDSDLKCEKGGEFKTALNTDIFLAVWMKVVEDGRFRYHDWTVKVDPDAVFFAERLRIAVSFHHDPGTGVYLNNCKYGLHGPIEVLSREAVLAWAKGSSKCVAHFLKLCSGPCLWGEDMFLDQCLWKVLNVKRVNDWNLLSEAHCDSKDWHRCQNGDIAFHPFKTVQGYRRCLADAHFGALPTT